MGDRRELPIRRQGRQRHDHPSWLLVARTANPRVVSVTAWGRVGVALLAQDDRPNADRRVPAQHPQRLAVWRPDPNARRRMLLPVAVGAGAQAWILAGVRQDAFRLDGLPAPARIEGVPVMLRLPVPFLPAPG